MMGWTDLGFRENSAPTISLLAKASPRNFLVSRQIPFINTPPSLCLSLLQHPAPAVPTAPHPPPRLPPVHWRRGRQLCQPLCQPHRQPPSQTCATLLPSYGLGPVRVGGLGPGPPPWQNHMEQRHLLQEHCRLWLQRSWAPRLALWDCSNGTQADRMGGTWHLTLRLIWEVFILSQRRGMEITSSLMSENKELGYLKLQKKKILDKERVTKTPARSHWTALGRGEGLPEKPPLPLHTHRWLWPPRPALLPCGEGGGQGSQAPSCQSSQPWPSWNREPAGRAARCSSAAGGRELGAGWLACLPVGPYSLINATH